MNNTYLPFITSLSHGLKGMALSIAMLTMFFASAQVTFEKEIKISDKGLFFDGQDVDPGTPNNGPKYDFIFGNRITPHGDCIKEYDGFVFMTWYRGGKYDRHVMLSRYNTRTGITKTIEFGHRHTGFQNQPHLGESHNTIAIGICPIDGTIHMLYDMHAYSDTKPSNGSLANDYFRYTFSKKNAATVPDNQFNINQFVKDSDGDYKHLKMRNGTNYKSLTYPNFFTNKRGELFMWIREGGNNNGAYKFCKYNGNSWSDFTQFNVLNAKSRPGINYNWGLYGDIKFSGGKMRIGFVKRMNDNNDKYKYNNGFHYAYSDDPNGLTQWKDHKGRSVSLPVINPEKIQFSEPGNLVPSSGANSVTISSGADWITTDNEDIHFVSRVRGSDGRWKEVHTYKKASQDNFTTSTAFPGGNLYSYNGDVYLIGLDNGRIFVEKAPGGTNNWTRIYHSPSDGRKFRHGNVYIDNGKLYFYLMERKSGSAQPIYLQIYDLGLDDVNQAPVVSITSPANNATFEVGQEIALKASASDPDGNLDKVNFKINDDFYKTVATRPFEYTFTPTEPGTYKIAALAIDKENKRTETFVTITVVEKNDAPVASFTAPDYSSLEEGYSELYINVDATDPDGDDISVMLKIDGQEIRSETLAPFEWGQVGTPNANETIGLAIGDHVFEAVVTDAKGLSTTISKTITITEKNIAPTASFTMPAETVLNEGYPELVVTVDATDPNGDDISVLLKINGQEIRSESVAPYEWGHGGSPNPSETVGLTVGDHVFDAVVTDAKGLSTTISKTITVDKVMGTSTIVNGNELTVFPNPSKNGIYNLSKPTKYRLFNALGSSVKVGDGNVIDISTYPEGVYLLKTDEKVIQLVH